MQTLRSIKPGTTAWIVRINGEGAVKRRLMDMGLTRGTKVHVQKVAPLGDPVEISVRGYELSLRKAEAELVQVTTSLHRTHNHPRHTHNRHWHRGQGHSHHHGPHQP